MDHGRWTMDNGLQLAVTGSTLLGLKYILWSMVYGLNAAAAGSRQPIHRIKEIQIVDCRLWTVD